MADLGFDVGEFLALPFAERGDLCVKLAARAKGLADAMPLRQQEHYLLIAREWLRLAEEMERAVAEGGKS